MKVLITRKIVVEMSKEAFDHYRDNVNYAVDEVESQGNDWTDSVEEAPAGSVKAADWEDPEDMELEEDDDDDVDTGSD